MDMDNLDDIIQQLCADKADEFRLYGYENVTGEQIWQCVSEPYQGTLPRLHRLTNDILTLNITSFMNWMTLNAYKGIALD